MSIDLEERLHRTDTRLCLVLDLILIFTSTLPVHKAPTRHWRVLGPKCLHTAMHSIGLHLKALSSIVFYWLLFKVFLQVPTNHDILLQFLRLYYKWRQLHQPPDRTWRHWSVYPTFSFQVLLLTILNTAATQVLGESKRQDSEHDSFRTQRSRILDSDGLMVQYQSSIIVKHLAYLFSYYRFWRQATSSCVGNLSVTATIVIAYTSLPMETV